MVGVVNRPELPKGRADKQGTGSMSRDALAAALLVALSLLCYANRCGGHGVFALHLTTSSDSTEGSFLDPRASLGHGLDSLHGRCTTA